MISFNTILESPMNVTEDRGSYTENWGVRFVRWLFGWEYKRLANIAKVFGNYLDKHENVNIKEHHTEENVRLLSEKIRKTCSTGTKGNRIWKNTFIKSQYDEFKQKITAFKYRNGLVDKSVVDKKQLDTLHLAAKRWKDELAELYDGKTAITEKESAILKQTCTYPKFVKRLLANKTIREAFFKWTLRDNNSPDIFIQFPNVCKRIHQSFLSSRIGYFGPDYLKMAVDKHHCLDVTLPFFENGSVNRYSVFGKKVEEALAVFRNKNVDVGNLEVTQKGIISFNVKKWSYGNNLVDLSSPDWLEQLPVFEELTKEQVMKRFGLEELGDEESVVAAMASKETGEMDIVGHGYLSVAKRVGEDKFHFYAIGKFARHFPHTLWGSLKMIGSTEIGDLEFIDENIFYSQRMQAKSPVRIDKTQCQILFNEIQKTALEARADSIIFQFGYENCAIWPQRMINSIGVIENFYQVKARESTPSVPVVKQVFQLARLFPRLEKVIFTILQIFLVSMRGIYVGNKFKSTWTSPFNYECKIFHPGQLFRLIKRKQLPGTITFGHVNK